jgi:hypothetical protein
VVTFQQKKMIDQLNWDRDQDQVAHKSNVRRVIAPQSLEIAQSNHRSRHRAYENAPVSIKILSISFFVPGSTRLSLSPE